MNNLDLKINNLVLKFKNNTNQDKKLILKIYFLTYYRVLKNYFISIVRNFKRSQTFTKERYDRIWSIDRIKEMYSTDSSQNIRLFNFKKKFFLAPEALMSRVYQTMHAELISDTNPETILEVGCGQGFHLKLLSSMFPNKIFYGIDQSKSGIDFARDKIIGMKLDDEITQPLDYKYYMPQNKNLFYKLQDATNLEFENNSIDFVYTNLALEQMDNIKFKVLKEIKRVSKKNILLIEPFKNFNRFGAKFFHHRSKKYFSLNVADIEDEDYKVVKIIDKIPGYISLGVAGLLLKKK